MTESAEKLVNVIQGEYRISSAPTEVLSTVLGSCVAVCLTDPEARVGGMNHFLLPERAGKEGENVRYGAYSMELLINGLLKRGARKTRLTAKLFGGANMLSQLRDIGASNVRFAKEFLQNEAIPLASESTGGHRRGASAFGRRTGVSGSSSCRERSRRSRR